MTKTVNPVRECRRAALADDARSAGILTGYKCGLVFNCETKKALAVCTSITRTADTTDLAREIIEIVSE